MDKFRNKNKDKFDRSEHKFSQEKMELTISNISKKYLGKRFSVDAIVDGIVQTTGPTLFTIVDGTGSFVVKAFEGAGVRAFPELKIGDAVSVFMQLNEFNNALEGEAMSFKKLEPSKAEALNKKIEAEYERRATPPNSQFLIKSHILDKLKPSLMEAAKQIRLAVFKNRPIIIRHHNDADGYSSGYSLERAILPLVMAQHGTDKHSKQYCSKTPNISPFY